jgi:ribosomal-protein-alanine N-acetyltransferase
MMIAHKVQYWPMFSLQENKFVGCAGLRPYKNDERLFEMGVHLLPGCWGQGFGQEAARAVIKVGFERLAAKSLFVASRRLLERLGFRFTHEEFYAPTGLNHPSYRLMNPGVTTAPQGDADL